MLRPERSAFPCPRTLRWVSTLGLAVLALGLPSRAVGSTPTLESIKIDGDFDDWTRVLANPLQVSFDHDGSTMDCGYSSDADCPVQGSGRDLRVFAWTWDDTYLYVLAGRQAQFANQQAFWCYLDVTGPAGVPDALMGTGDFVLRIVYKGGDGSTYNDLYAYLPVDPAGDPMADASGRADGFDVPGTLSSRPTWTETAPHGGSSDGLEFEERVPWAALGVDVGWPLNFHVGSSNSPNPSNLPAQVDDNLGGLDGRVGSLAFGDPSIEPDRSARVDASAGAVVSFPHVVGNEGNATSTFGLAATSTTGFELALRHDPDCDGVPDGAPLAIDANGDGDFEDAGDFVAPDADSDGDGWPDTGPLGAGAWTCIVVELRIPPGTSGLHDVTTVEAFMPAARISTADTATDRTAIGTLTLERSMSGRAAAGNRADYALVACNSDGSEAVQLQAVSGAGWGLALLADDDCDGVGDSFLGGDADGDGTWEPPVPGDSDGDGRPDVVIGSGACACLVLSIAVDPMAALGDEDITAVTASTPGDTAGAVLATTVAEPVDLVPDYLIALPDLHCGVAAGPDRTEVLVGPGKSAFFPHVLENALPSDGSFALDVLDHVQPWPARFWSDPDGDGRVGDGAIVDSQDGVPRNGGRASIVLEIRVPSTAPLGEIDRACARALSAAGPVALAADELRVSSLLTFSDATFTLPATVFAPCDAVHVQATALPRGSPGNRIVYELQYRDPAGALARTLAAVTDAGGEITDRFDLPPTATGPWTITLSDASGVVATVRITVEAAVSLAPLATARPSYQLVGDDVTVVAFVRNEGTRVTLTSLLRSYAVVDPGGATYYDDATRTWMPFSGTESTRQRGPDNLTPGQIVDDGFTLLAVDFPMPGLYQIQGRVVDVECGAVLMTRARAFVVGAAEIECADGVDNDGDGRTDCADPDCIGDPACPEVDNCSDGIDNDGDTLVDCLDPDCIGDAACPETGHCADGIDNDLDGLVDCADPDCVGDAACPETDNCSDGVDNDGDGLVDCEDPDCVGDPACPETGHCSDGIDNDGDGDIDCADFDCIGDPACPENEHCDDGIDNDDDGLVDCFDPDCLADPGADCDGDGVPNGVDCAPADPTAFALPPVIDRLDVRRPGPRSSDAVLTWADVAPRAGTGTVNDVFTGRIDELRADRGYGRASCLGQDLPSATATDPRLVGWGAFYYLVRAQNSCGDGPMQDGSAGPIVIDGALCD